MKCGIELQQKLFILVLFVCHELQKTNIPKAVKSFFKTGQPNNSFTIQTHVWKDSLLIVQNAGVVASLLMAPKSIG